MPIHTAKGVDVERGSTNSPETLLTEPLELAGEKTYPAQFQPTASSRTISERPPESVGVKYVGLFVEFESVPALVCHPHSVQWAQVRAVSSYGLFNQRDRTCPFVAF